MEFFNTDDVIFNANIGEAIEQMRSGNLVARKGWNGKNMFIFFVPGSTFIVNRPPLNIIYPEGTEINYQSHIDMKTADGTVVPWLCSQTDLLANDYGVIGSRTITLSNGQN